MVRDSLDFSVQERRAAGEVFEDKSGGKDCKRDRPFQIVSESRSRIRGGEYCSKCCRKRTGADIFLFRHEAFLAEPIGKIHPPWFMDEGTIGIRRTGQAVQQADELDVVGSAGRVA